MATDPLARLRATLRDLASWFRACSVRGVIIGGVAAGVLGRPRVTRDVDALIVLEEQEWAAFVSRGASHGFQPRIRDALPFAHQARVLLMRHRPTRIPVDISLGLLPFEEETIARARSRTVQGVRLSFPSPEDLVIMKAVAHRVRDLADIEGILDSHPPLDLDRIRRWVGIFSEAMDRPELAERLDQLLAKRARKRKSRRQR